MCRSEAVDIRDLNAVTPETRDQGEFEGGQAGKCPSLKFVFNEWAVGRREVTKKACPSLWTGMDSLLRMMVTSTLPEGYNERNLGSDVAAAAFTTSYARLKLLDTMEKLGEWLLHFDTDSVIFIQKPGQCEPPIGNISGDWDNQLDKGESHILWFVPCVPNVYGYENDTGKIE